MLVIPISYFFFFFFNDTATTEIYTLSLHDALPISIKIKAGDKEASQKVVVEEDTRIVITAADRTARREMIDQLYPMAKTTDKDRKTIEGIQTVLKAAREQWKKDVGKPNTTKIPDDVVKAADELQKKVDAEAEKFIRERDRKSTRLNSSHGYISYAVFCLKKKNILSLIL